MKNKPLVSIITPVYNSSLFLEETIKSVLRQDFVNWEWLMVDDLSTDNSIQIIKRYADSDSRINLIASKLNIGSGPARNLAIQESKDGKDRDRYGRGGFNSIPFLFEIIDPLNIAINR